MSTDLFDLTGKIALVTGASRGIGEAAARLLAQQGAHVIISSRKQESCEEVAASIRDEDGRATAYACHIGDPEQIEAIFEHIRQVHGRLDILVNNAAANPYYGHITDTDMAAFTKTVEVNIRGYFFMSANACKLMKESGGGAIVNVSSVDGIRPGDKRGIYSITKSAIIQMTKAFALECGPDNIRVNALLPGLTETKFAGALTENEEVLNAWLKQMPLRRYAQPDEMAGAILFLASPASGFATGSILPVDGGYLI
ncbi:MAG: SDR family oxidoreductase [Gammaproteobacteria bacterium]|nr:SDR family oxidoreductase [Gammaproteobacteria bacterium]